MNEFYHGSKEIVGEELNEAMSISLVGGFVTWDPVFGCKMNCKFCLAKRCRMWRRVQADGFLSKYDLDAVTIGEILMSMRPITQARIPLRIGHCTDTGFNWGLVLDVIRRLPPENPVILLTRMPVPRRFARILQEKRQNVMLKITLTPPSQSLEYYHDPLMVLGSVLGIIPQESLFFAITPITADNADGASSLLEFIPRGAWIDLKALTKSGVPKMTSIPPVSEATMEALRQKAIKRKMHVTDFFGCRLRLNFNRPFYKFNSCAAYTLDNCKHCPQYHLCSQMPDMAVIREHTREVAHTIGLTIKDPKTEGSHTLRFHCSEPSSRFDESFLSEIVNHRILLTSVPPGSEGSCCVSQAILNRWEKYNLLPVSRIAPSARKVLSSYYTWKNQPGRTE